MLQVEHFSLALQAELLDERVVRLLIFLLEVLEMLAAVRYHLQESTARVKIFLVLAQV